MEVRWKVAVVVDIGGGQGMKVRWKVVDADMDMGVGVGALPPTSEARPG